MKIASVILGTRGDVQPMIALATGLMETDTKSLSVPLPSTNNLPGPITIPAPGTRAGIPQAAFPFVGDQFANRDQISRLKLGPDTCNFKKMTAEAITSAIKEVTTNELYRKNAKDLSEKLQQVNGVKLTAQLIEKILQAPQ